MGAWQPLPEELPAEVRHFVEQLRLLKDRTGMSLVALGTRTAYSKSSWQRYLNASQPPPRQAVVALCRVAGVAGEETERFGVRWELAVRAWPREPVPPVPPVPPVRVPAGVPAPSPSPAVNRLPAPRPPSRPGMAFPPRAAVTATRRSPRSRGGTCSTRSRPGSPPGPVRPASSSTRPSSPSSSSSPPSWVPSPSGELSVLVTGEVAPVFPLCRCLDKFKDLP